MNSSAQPQVSAADSMVGSSVAISGGTTVDDENKAMEEPSSNTSNQAMLKLSSTLSSRDLDRVPSAVDNKAGKNESDNAADPWAAEEVEKAVHVWNLTVEEQGKLEQLRERLRDIEHEKNNPDMVIRFMKARPKSLEDGEKMFRDMIQWRLKNDVDSILEEYTPPRGIRDYVPGAILEQYSSLTGEPIYCERIGSAHSWEMIRRYGEDHLVKHAIWIREQIVNGEWVKEYERRQGRPVKQIIVVEDLHGLSTGHLDRHLLNAFQKITRLDQDNYPEAASKILNVNAPFVLRLAWSLVKHFFDPQVAAKMVFASHGHTKEVLEKYVGDLSVLPPEIVPEGRGKAAKGLNPNFKGGPLPPEEELGEDIPPTLTSKRKETATTEDMLPAPDDDDNDSNSVISNKTYLSWATPVRTFIRKQEMKRAKEKENEIRNIRDMHEKRLQPKVLSQHDRDRLVRLQKAKERRRQAHGTLKSWSEKLTDHLETHGQIQKVCNLLGLLLLFFALLHPELVEILTGIHIKPISSSASISSEVQGWWFAVCQGFGLLGYLFFCGVVHFGVCDIALVYAFFALDLGSKTGKDVKKYYSENIRMIVAATSFSIFGVSVIKSLANIVLSMIVAGLSLLSVVATDGAKSQIGYLWTVIMQQLSGFFFSFDKNLAEEEIHQPGSLGYLKDVATTAANLVTNATEAFQEEFSYVTNMNNYEKTLSFSFVTNPFSVDDVDTAIALWQTKAFETARLLFSYTSVFLLVFLVLFNYSAGSGVLKSINEQRGGSLAQDDDSVSQATDLLSQESFPQHEDISTVTSTTPSCNQPNITLKSNSDVESDVSVAPSQASTNSKRRRFRILRSRTPNKRMAVREKPIKKAPFEPLTSHVE